MNESIVIGLKKDIDTLKLEIKRITETINILTQKQED